MKKEEMKKKWMDESKKNGNNLYHNCKENQGPWCENCPYYNKTISTNDNKDNYSENKSKNKDNTKNTLDITNN